MNDDHVYNNGSGYDEYNGYNGYNGYAGSENGNYSDNYDEAEQIPEYAMIPAGGAASATSTAEAADYVPPEPQSLPQNEKSEEEQKAASYTNAEPVPAAMAVSPAPAAPSPATEKPAKPANTINTNENEQPVKLISAAEDLKSNRLRLSGMHSVDIPDIRVEEDILVPDTRPDLEKIVSITATADVADHEAYVSANGENMLKISGNFEISTLYLPAGRQTELVSITSKIPFRREFQTKEPVSRSAEIRLCGAVTGSRVINERKIRVSAQASFTIREYGDTEIELLEGVRDESLLLKKEKIRFTDMAQRRTDTAEIREKIRLKDSAPVPRRILRYDTDIVENHRQISKGKAVIEASVYYSILYAPEADGETEALPVFMRGKTEFTQFLRLPEVSDEDIAGSIVNFEILKSDISLHSGTGAGADDTDNDEENDNDEYDEEDDSSADINDMPYFVMNVSAAASIQVYRSIEREVVTDMYHRSRELEFSTAPYEISELCGSGSAEVSIRETVNIPEEKGNAAAVPYVWVRPENIKVVPEQDRCVIQGKMAVSVIFSDENTGSISCFDTSVPFRSVTDMPGVREDSRIEYEPAMKDIWFDRMNSHQADLNCSLSIRICAWNVTAHEFIDKVCYIEDGKNSAATAGIVVYMVRPGDTQWSVSKKFRTTMETLRSVNGLEEEQELTSGMRLLIV